MRDPTTVTNKNAKRYGHSWGAVSLIVEPPKWESCKAGTTITSMNFTAVEIGSQKLSISEPTALRPKWDDKQRRPSYKNKRDLVSRKIVFENFSRNIVGTKPDEIRETILRLARLLKARR